jgi:hypothetical protein
MLFVWIIFAYVTNLRSHSAQNFLSTTQNHNDVGAVTLMTSVSTRHLIYVFTFALLFWEFAVHPKVLSIYIWIATLGLVIPAIEEYTVNVTTCFCLYHCVEK